VRLALVRQKYTPFGGAERFVALAVDALRARSVEVEVIARNWTGNSQGVICDPFFIGRTWRDFGFASCAKKIINSGRYDLVQSHERIPGCDIYRAGDGVHATWLELRSKFLSNDSPSLDGLSPWHQYTLGTERALFAHSRLKAVICNSEMVKADITSRFKFPESKLHVIYNGVDTKVFNPGLRESLRYAWRDKHHIEKADGVVLYVGSGYKRKGVGYLLRSLAKLKDKNTVAVVVGRDSSESRYISLAKKLGVMERVRFLGPLDDVRPAYAAADVFCLPTIYDPMPNVVLEALACGLPVITTATCGGSELIQNGVNGYIVDPLNVDGLSGCMESLCEMSGNGRMRDICYQAVSGISIDAMAEKMISLYRDVLKVDL
jgi:UDP-glucose:(heptosyl)LPS alpha-1,3-glucosyltransferase